MKRAWFVSDIFWHFRNIFCHLSKCNSVLTIFGQQCAGWFECAFDMFIANKLSRTFRTHLQNITDRVYSSTFTHILIVNARKLKLDLVLFCCDGITFRFVLGCAKSGKKTVYIEREKKLPNKRNFSNDFRVKIESIRFDWICHLAHTKIEFGKVLARHAKIMWSLLIGRDIFG